MPRPLKETSPLAAEILDGKHDADLDYIRQACAHRLKMRFRKGTAVRLTGTRNAHLEGKEGVILKVNARSISVGVGKAETDQWGTTYDGGEYNVPPAMLEAL